MEYEPAETRRADRVSSVFDRIDDTASENGHTRRLDRKSYGGARMQRTERAGCVNPRGKWGDNEMEKKKRNKCFEFLKHFWKPMSIMIWLPILIEALQLRCSVHCKPSWSLQLVRRVEDFGRHRGIEKEFGSEVQCETHW